MTLLALKKDRYWAIYDDQTSSKDWWVEDTTSSTYLSSSSYNENTKIDKTESTYRSINPSHISNPKRQDDLPKTDKENQKFVFDEEVKSLTRVDRESATVIYRDNEDEGTWLHRDKIIGQVWKIVGSLSMSNYDKEDMVGEILVRYYELLQTLEARASRYTDGVLPNSPAYYLIKIRNDMMNEHRNRQRYLKSVMKNTQPTTDIGEDYGMEQELDIVKEAEVETWHASLTNHQKSVIKEYLETLEQDIEIDKNLARRVTRVAKVTRDYSDSKARSRNTRKQGYDGLRDDEKEYRFPVTTRQVSRFS